AQQCKDYWKGRAPFCNPDSNCNPGWHYSGVQDVRGDGARCVTGKKKLCQCNTPGGGPPCQPTLPPKTLTILHGWVTICDNGCNVYICGVKSIRFWKRALEEVKRRGLEGVHRRRLLPCEDGPEQPHCQQPDPVDPTPPNDISSKPLTQDDVLQAFKQTEYEQLVERLAALGESTEGKSQDELVQVGYGRFQSTMVTLDIDHIDPKASLDSFEKGPEALTYFSDESTPVE
ncbi:MAG: hypothetical protein Q9166_007498, partial [cf. Caloplaca sp. 2 TL-2023]